MTVAAGQPALASDVLGLLASVQASVTTETIRAQSAEAESIGRNRLHNGSFEVAQRGLGPFTASAYTADGWMQYYTGGVPSTSFGAVTGYSSRKAATVTATLAAGNSVKLYQRIESANTYDLVGQQVTVSLSTSYTVSAGAPAFVAQLLYPSVVDNFGTTTLIQAVAFAPTGTPGTYSAVFSALPAGAANGLELDLVVTQAAATGTLAWTVTSVQLEPGAIATPFERRAIGFEMALCQRYYQKYPTVLVAGYGAAAGGVYLDLSFAVPMFSVPAVTFANLAYNNATAMTLNGALNSHAKLAVTTTVIGPCYGVGDVMLSAEL